jgi:protein gp37
MNTTKIRLSKSGIEYLDYMWGIFSGCHNQQEGICHVPKCWAKSLTTRFTNIYPNGFEPTFYLEAIDSPKYLKKPSRIGVGWVGDVIGYGLKYKEQIYNTVQQCPQHTFLFLTKNPERLKDWSPFPSNCYVGVTTTGFDGNSGLEDIFANIQARIKFVSIEPLLDYSPMDFRWVDWIILGQLTPISVKTQPKIEWIRKIALTSKEAGIPYFLKDNLASILPDDALYWKLGYKDGHFTEAKPRQEFPV